MSTARLRITLAQLNLVVGDIAGNTERVRAAACQARDESEASERSTVLGFTFVTLELTIHIVNRGGSTGSIYLDLPSEGTVSDSRWTNPEEPLRYRMNVPDGASAVRILRPSAEETLSLSVQLWPEIEHRHDNVQGNCTLKRLQTASAFAQYLTSGLLGPFTLPDTELNNPEYLTF